MKAKKRFFSLLLALCLVVGLLPTSALAAETRVTVGNFNVEGDSSTYSYSNGVLTVNNGASLTISTNGQTSDRIVVNGNAEITLNGVNITGAAYDNINGTDAQSAIDVSENATLVLNLSGSSQNVLTGGEGKTGVGAPGIHVPDSASLVIQGSGGLSVAGGNSTSTYGGNGIGGTSFSGQAGESCGTVIILATGDITISGGTGLGSGGGGVDIGGGKGHGYGGNGQGIRPVSGQENTYTVWGNLTLPCDITIPEGATVVIPENASLTVPENVTLTNNGTIRKDGGSFINDGTVTGQQPADDRYSINYAEETITIGEGYEVYTAETGDDKIESNSSITAYIGKSLYLQKTDPETTGRTEIKIPNRPEAPTLTSASIDYSGEKLNFPPDVTETTLEYALSQSDPNWQDVPSGAALSEMGWDGSVAKTYYFRTGATDTSFASSATTTPITAPARPEAPNDLNLMDYTNVSVTYYVGAGVQCRLGNEGAWVTLGQDETDYTFTGLTPQTTYTIYARKPATESQFASDEASDEVTTKSSAAEPPAMTYEVTANSITLSYSAPWQYQTSDDEWISVEGSKEFTSLEAATEYTFTVRVAESETAEASKVGTVKVYTAHATPTVGEGYSINYGAETIFVNSGYEVNTAKDFTGTVIQSDASLSDYTGQILYIRHKADEGGAPASAAAAISIPARPAAPTGLTITEESSIDGEDGKITGVTTAMEYRADTTGDWTACGGTEVTGLAPGSYQVRLRATSDSFASEAETVIIKEHTCVAQSKWQADEENHWHNCTSENCNEKLNTAAHTYGGWQQNNDDTHTRTCSVCGYQQTGNCSGGTATCSQLAVCDTCGSQYGNYDADNHKAVSEWTQENGKHYHKCEYGCDTHLNEADCSGGEATCTALAVCDTCGEEYGKVNASNHTNLVKTEAKAATHMAEGNIEYWYCDGCDKYFSDEAGTKEIALKDTVIPKLTEHTADGTGWHSDKTGHWNTCECGEKLNEAAHTFEWVIDKEATAAEKGSKHEKCTVCGYEKAAVEIPATGTPSDTDTSSPQTGDDSNIALWIAVMLAAGADLTGTAVYSRQRNPRK